MIKRTLSDLILSSLLLINLCVLANSAIAAPHTITLPTETAKLKESILPGYMIAQQKCAICHSADYINLQPPGMTLKQWTAEVTKMQHAYGAPITNDDIKVIAEYLAVTYGNEKMPVMPMTTKAENITAVNQSAKSIDVKTLLGNNACLSCHAINTKIVGPAYHDVAERYHNNPKALVTVMANIKAGGANKWGEMAMPPFSMLSDAELKALAEFVLSQ